MSRTAMMQAGTYYVGDLCYVLRDAWSDVCNIIIVGQEVLNGTFNLPDGRRFAMFSTAWGDGQYFDTDRNPYAVDSGSIGCIRLEDCEKTEEEIRAEALGSVITFEKSFEVSSDGKVLTFGHVSIDTDPPYEDEEDEYPEDEDYGDEY